MLIGQGGIVGLKQAAKLVSRKTSQNSAAARKDLRFQQEERNIRNILSSREGERWFFMRAILLSSRGFV